MADYNNPQLQSLQRELEALKQLYNFLVERVHDRLNLVSAQYRTFIGALVQTGVPVQECIEYRDKYYQVDAANFKALIGRIKDDDLRKIDQYIKQVLNQYSALSGFNVGSINLRQPSTQTNATPSHFKQPRPGSQQNYDIQLHALCNLMDFMVDQRNEMLQTLYDYQGLCNRMLDWGVPIQVMQHYKLNCFDNNARQMRVIVEHIQGEDYKQLTGMFTQINNAMTALGNSFPRQPKSM